MLPFPVAPRLRVRLPRAVHAGQSCVAEILVDASRPVSLDWIDARLECVERWMIGGGNASVSRREALVALAARVFEGGVLPAGPHAFPVRFDLPPSLPPSLELAGVAVETLIRVHASIPWWPDATGSFVVPLRAAPTEPTVAPYRATNRASGADVPRIEISLASRIVPARGVLSGAVAFFHHDARVVRGAVMTLAARALLREARGAQHVHDVTAYTVALPREPPVDGTPIPFRVRLPDAMPPTLSSRAFAIEWQLRVERPGFVRGATWISVPLEVREAGEDVADDRALEVPPVGDTRLAAMLAATAAAHDLAVEGGALVGTVGAVRLRIAREVRPHVGSAFVAELELPRLGLDLVVERARWLPSLLGGSLLGGEVEIGVPELDAKLHVRARDSEQARGFLAPLAGALGPGTLVRLDDHAARLEHPDPQLDDASLDRFASHARAIARALDAAIRTMPPPSALDADLGAWDEAARALGARLVRGDLSIAGSSGESAVSIETRLDPPEHVVRARPVPPLPEGLSISIADPRAESATIAASRGAALAAVLASLPPGARSLSIRGGEAELRLPLGRDGEGARPRTDPAAALRAATLLAGLGARLAPQRGPFR